MKIFRNPDDNRMLDILDLSINQNAQVEYEFDDGTKAILLIAYTIQPPQGTTQ